jgi:hypothetical protein
LQTWLGSTKKETLELISKKREAVNSQLYELQDEKIILTYLIGQDSNGSIGGKATFYFKNKISYKVEIEIRTTGKITLGSDLGVYIDRLHEEFYEDKTKELGTSEMKYTDGEIRRFKHTSAYWDFSKTRAGYTNATSIFYIDENGNSPTRYGSDYGEYSKIFVFSKPGWLVKLDYNYGGVHDTKYYTYTYPNGYNPPEGLSKRKRKKFIEHRDKNKTKKWTNIYIRLGPQKLVVTIEVSYS